MSDPRLVALAPGAAEGPLPADFANARLVASDGRGIIRGAGIKGDKAPALRRGHDGGTDRPADQKGRNAAGCGGLVRIETLAERVEELARLAASWIVLQACNGRGKPVEVDGIRWRTAGFAHLSRLAIEKGFTARADVGCLASKVEGLSRRAPAEVLVVAGRAEQLPARLPRNLRGAVVYLDPPYKGCTGYGWDVERRDLVAMAREYVRRGAVVGISEAVGLAEELGPGWRQEDITSAAGKKAEWLTWHRPPVQLRLL